VLSHAIEAAQAIQAMSGFKTTRAGFAVEALRGRAEAGEQFLLLRIGSTRKNKSGGC
jgi:hypothetical protein